MPPEPAPHWPIRTALANEAEAIAELHRAAILAACTSHYSGAQIRAWVQRTTPALHAAAIAERRVRVALDDGALCGFSTATMGQGMLNALYVAPFAMHRGVGRALLADVEEALLAAGRHELRLHATLNAVDFYRWLGFVDEGDATRRLPSGVALACVAMRKPLAALG